MLTTNQVAQRLGINPSRVRQIAAAEQIGTRIGRDWMFTDEDLAAMAARKTTPGPRRLSATLVDAADGFDEIGASGVARQLRRIATNHAAERIATGDARADPPQTY